MKKNLSLHRFSKEHLPRVGQKTKKKSKTYRAFSSAGSEHLPYKQRVGGSNPSTPTF